MGTPTREIIEKVRGKVSSYEFKIDSRTKKEHFTRESPLNFETIMMFTLKLVKKSMQIEINEYFDETGKESFVTKQAFSKARQKIRWEAFEELFKITVETGKEADQLRYYNGKYRLLAVDGTTVALESKAELIEYFGCSGGSKTAATARVSVLQDVYSGVLYDAIMGSCREGERRMAARHLKRLSDLDDRENIVVFDRGYVSDELIAGCCDMGHYFVMRIRDRWHEKLVKKAASGDIVTIHHRNKVYPVKIIKLTLPNGTEEVLFSNIDFLETSDFGKIYALRWTVETKYDTIKNIIQLENTSGLTAASVLQDFFACMTIANMLAFAKLEADEKINKANADKGLKREYQASNTMLMGTLRMYFTRMVVADDDEVRDYYADIFFGVIERFSDVKQDHGRSYPRINKTQRRKYPLRKKSVL